MTSPAPSDDTCEGREDQSADHIDCDGASRDPLSLLCTHVAHHARAVAHFTNAARAGPGEDVLARSPDLDSDMANGTYRHGRGFSLSCSSYGSVDDGVETHPRTAPTVASGARRLLGSPVSPWMPSNAAVTAAPRQALLPPRSPPPLQPVSGPTTTAEVVWRAGGVAAGLEVSSAAATERGPPASALASTSPATPGAAAPAHARTRWPTSALMPQQRHVSVPAVAAAEPADDAWEDDIFDEGGGLVGAAMCRWLWRRASTALVACCSCCCAPPRRLRSFHERRGFCTRWCGSRDCVSESGSAVESDTEEAPSWSSRSAARPSAAVAGDTDAEARRPLLPRAERDRNTARALRFDAAATGAVAAGIEHEEDVETSSDDLIRAEPPPPPPPSASLVSVIVAALRQAGAGARRALASTAAYYNVCSSACRAADGPSPPLVELPRVGQVFVVLQYVALAVLCATVLLLAVVDAAHTRVVHVADATVCNGYALEDRVPLDLYFSLASCIVNGVLAVHYAVRAVRYERSGLLVVQVIVVALYVSRSTYFLMVVAARSMGSAAQRLFMLTCGGVLASTALFTASSLLAPWVHASFGWRRYAQGIVHVSLSQVRHRLTALRACVQLDKAMTINAYLATVFLVDGWAEQRTLLAVSLVSLVLHYVLIAVLRRTRHWWPLLCAAGVLVTASAYYATLIGRTLRVDHQLRSFSNAPWYSDCYTEQLGNCLWTLTSGHSVSICRNVLAVPLSLSPQRLASAGQHINTNSSSSSRGSTAVASDVGQVWGGRAAPPPPTCAAGPVRPLRNETDTYLPTHAAFPDFFCVHDCNATCFDADGGGEHVSIERDIAGCCADYGRCRLKDEYRTYAVLLLLALLILSFAVRMVLMAVAWRRWVLEDDHVIEHFVVEHQRRRRRQRRQRGASSAPRRRPRYAHAPRSWARARATSTPIDTATVAARADDEVGPQSPPSPTTVRCSTAAPAATPPPRYASSVAPSPLVWSVELYVAWRQDGAADAGAASSLSSPAP
ncbi:hypothetical protein NESM_000527100 [Novymonas esmeraldas]|uniref:Integral membrane protein n=1 Tax=Novymonas esmeraldas TaxID=1808958 RepID=A0AAW0EP55_9TRYP